MVNLTLYNPNFDLALGRAMHAWAIIDQSLGEWFEFLTKLPKEKSDLIFYSNKSFEDRLQLVFKLIENENIFNSKILSLLKNRIKIYNERRNYLVHSMPALSINPDNHEFPVDHILYSFKKKRKPLRISDLNESYESFVEVYDVLIGLLTIANNKNMQLEEYTIHIYEKISSLKNLS